MILKNVYFRKIELKDDSPEEFKQKLGEALDILGHATEDSYDQMGIDAFLDWVTDLHWIKEKNIVITVSGNVSKYIEDIMIEIVDFWKYDAKKVIAGGENRNFEFLLIDNK